MARTDTTHIVCDAGPIIHLDELDSLGLLAGYVILVPEGVWQEISRHRPGALGQDTVQLFHTRVTLPEDAEFLTLIRAFALDAGEQEALALMRQRPTAILLTDDAAARLVAERMGMRVHGTIGILLRAIRKSLRTPEQVLSLLHLLPERSTLYIRLGLLETVIARVQREFDLD